MIPGDSYVTLSSHEEVSLPFIPLEATVSVLAAPPPNYLPDDGAYLHGTPPWRETWARLTPLLLRFGGILACCNRHTSFRWQRKHILRQCGMLSYHLLFRRYHHGHIPALELGGLLHLSFFPHDFKQFVHKEMRLLRMRDFPPPKHNGDLHLTIFFEEFE